MIRHCFSAASVEAIVERLKSYDKLPFAQECLAAMSKANPLSLKVTAARPPVCVSTSVSSINACMHVCMSVSVKVSVNVYQCLSVSLLSLSINASEVCVAVSLVCMFMFRSGTVRWEHDAVLYLCFFCLCLYVCVS